MMRRSCKLSAALAATVLLFQPIAAERAQAQANYDTQGNKLSGKTHVEKAIGGCVASVLIGGIIGGIAEGEKGALIGAAAGGVVCALILRGASKKDKARIRDAQLRALSSNRDYSDSWTTDEGAAVNVAATPLASGSVLMTNAGSLECRRDDQCRIGDSWYPKAEILARNAAPDAPKVVKASFESSSELLCRKTRLVYGVDGQIASAGDDVSCLVGDTWVTSSEFKKQKIKDGHIII